MDKPDLETGRQFVNAHNPPGTILQCAVTGSHLYGFPSADSDLDLKGIHITPVNSLLGLEDPKETFDRFQKFQDVECDYTSHEIKKALGLLLRGNGTILERIMSPWQLFTSSEVRQLQALAQQSLSKKFFGHYHGFFQGMCRLHEKHPQPYAKSILYSYRVALTGIHLLETATIQTDLRELASQYGYQAILEAVEFKRNVGENAVLPSELDHDLRTRWLDLLNRISAAATRSQLPESPPNAEEVSAWLIRLRKKQLEQPNAV